MWTIVSLTKKINIESVALPDIQSAFHWFRGATVFTSLDLNSPYHQIPFKESSRLLTAFATDWNLYEFCRVPFGIATRAQVLTRLLDKVFSDIKFEYVYNYLDDLVIYSGNMEEHLDRLKEVFSRLQAAGQTVKLSKVQFATSLLSFLGHVITPYGIHLDPPRTQCIREFQTPKTAKDIARFLGMVNFFHKFVPNLAQIAAPLNALRKKGVRLQRGEAQAASFDQLKLAIANPPVLATADFFLRFIVKTDASSVAVVVVLL